MTEKLEDVVSIVFLPLVCVLKLLHGSTKLIHLTVLHAFRSFHRSRSTQHWHHLGVHDFDLRHGLPWKIRWMHHGGAYCWVQLARICNYRNLDEL